MLIKFTFKYSIAFFIVSFFSVSAIAENDTIANNSDKVYKIGLPQVPGVMWINTKGEIKGFVLELFMAIAEDEGIKYEWVEGDWPYLFDLIQKGEIDALPGTQETIERKNKIDFIENSLFTLWSELRVKESSKFTGISTLNGKKIGIVRGDNNGVAFEKYIEPFKISYQKVHLNSHEEGAQLLLDNEIFALVVPSFYAKQETYRGTKPAGLYFNPSNLKISFPKGKNEELIKIIDKCINRYKNDPNSVYNQLFNEYGLSSYNEPKVFVPKWLRILMLLVLTFLIVGLIFIVILRKQVQIKTQNLNMREIYLRRTMELGNMGTWFVDVKNWAIEWSPELYDLFGYSQSKKITFNFMRTIVHEDDLLNLTRVFLDSIRLHKNFEAEFKVKKSDGTWLYTKQIGVVYSDEEGRTAKVYGITQNITQQKKYDRQLIKAKEKAEESERLKSVFLANMSHEIRTPLNAIVGFSSLIAKGETDEGKRMNFVKIIEKQNTLLLNLINDIIDFAKIESKSLKLNFTDHVDLEEVIANIHAALKHNCPEKVDFKLVKNKFGAKHFVRTDVVRLKQIINNLIMNAFKYTSEGFVEVGCHQNSIENKLELYVKDSGVGIPDEHLGRIFDRFHQVNEQAQGTGLGLAICQSLAQMLGGSVILKATSHQGSEFILELPYSIIQSTSEELYPTSIVDEEIDIDSISFEGLTVLCAEDIDSNFLYLQTVLETKGIKIERAKDGIEAVQMATLNDYNLILMDIKMPKMDGLVASENIKVIKPKVPIIAITAHAFDADRTKALQAGCTEYISKPVDKDELLEVIGKVLELV